MARFVRLVLIFATLAPTPLLVGCGSSSDSAPNSQLGPPPNIPPGRGAGGGGGGPVDPNAPKSPKK